MPPLTRHWVSCAPLLCILVSFYMDFIGVIALKVGEEIGVIFGHGDGDLLLFVNKRYLEGYCIEKEVSCEAKLY